MLSRRELLATGTAFAALPAAAGAEPAAIDRGAALAAARSRPESLAGRAARSGILFGTELDVWDMGDAVYLDAIARESSILVPGNALKANQYRKSPDSFEFGDADRIYDFASAHQLAFRGHTLCWFNSVPDWVEKTLTKPAAIRRELVAEVMEPVRHFAGRMQSWDVVNEIVRPQDEQPMGLRKMFWQQALGPEFVELAFSVAHENDPDALLCLNDMDLEYDHAYFETKRQAVLSLLKLMVRNGIPIGGVGIQCHMQYAGIAKFPFSKDVFHRFLSDIADLGLKVILSELDVPDKNLPADIGDRDAMVSHSVGELLQVAVDHPAVIAIVNWCITDRYSWIGKDPNFARADGLPSRGALLDHAMVPKQVYWAAAKAFDDATVQR